MKTLSATLLAILGAQSALAASPEEIIAANTRAMVYLEVEDATGGILDRGSGFIVSHDGYVLTAAHIKVDPTQKMWAVIGQRQGTRYRLSFRDADERSDTALWQLPQSATCRYAATLATAPVAVLDRVLVLGFPGNDGLTPSRVGINNVTTDRGFYKADGFLRPGNSGGPVFNEKGYVVAMVEGGGLPGTENNDLIPVSPGIDLIRKHGVRAGIDSPAPFENACYARCRSAEHGVEKWNVERGWGPVGSGWLSGGHNRQEVCNTLMAAELAANPGAQIDLLPGEGGMWEENKKDPLGHVEYRYFCRGVFRSGAIFLESQSPACGLWN